MVKDGGGGGTDFVAGVNVTSRFGPKSLGTLELPFELISTFARLPADNLIAHKEQIIRKCD